MQRKNMTIRVSPHLKKRIVKVSHKADNGKYVIGIRVAGNYLEKLGFNFGDLVEITPIAEGQLTICRKGAVIV